MAALYYYQVTVESIHHTAGPHTVTLGKSDRAADAAELVRGRGGKLPDNWMVLLTRCNAIECNDGDGNSFSIERRKYK